MHDRLALEAARQSDRGSRQRRLPQPNGRIRTAVPHATISVPDVPISEVSYREATIASAPDCGVLDVALLGARQPSARSFVRSLNSPPTSGFIAAPMAKPIRQSATTSALLAHLERRLRLDAYDARCGRRSSADRPGAESRFALGEAGARRARTRAPVARPERAPCGLAGDGRSTGSSSGPVIGRIRARRSLAWIPALVHRRCPTTNAVAGAATVAHRREARASSRLSRKGDALLELTTQAWVCRLGAAITLRKPSSGAGVAERERVARLSRNRGRGRCRRAHLARSLAFAALRVRGIACWPIWGPRGDGAVPSCDTGHRRA